uniref:Secreted protein n=1 Tax=Arundo donax TaxID=35708 RepID=A0A0A9GXF2_ARUDO
MHIYIVIWTFRLTVILSLLQMKWGYKERSERLEYHQRTSHRQRCVEVSYPRAKTMTRFRGLMGFNSSLPQFVRD